MPILTGRNDVTDRVLGLESAPTRLSGQTLEPRELVARVRSILRRYLKAPADAFAQTAAIACFAGWQLRRPALPRTRRDGREVHLSTAEAALLQSLL